ncbi:proton-conducting transporter membrane subunit [Acidithiobacillus sp. AMEEHan]|uniref:proton-conducting transporter transmembrane domain-containing protein n=1 Tax=Acidithiobacillus sp. AMEEHan TaxID=2994951 RepID=UPI0027E416DC|nr:proton-conducting transporter membrane subunit [Acidithiobacillus sp. AMEEHan]
MANFDALIATLWIVPGVAIVAILAIRRPRWAEFLNLLSAIAVFALTLAILVLAPNRAWVGGAQYLLLTPLGAWVLFCVGVVYLLASIYAIGYMRLLPEEEPRLHTFYALQAGFALTMLIAPVMNNPGIFWIAIDFTTIVSAFLVGFEREAECIEAAWKYLIVVSAGLALALLGIILFYWGGTFSLGPTYALTWANLRATAPKVPEVLLFFSFLLTLVGFGTKVGLAPMHTWLPDAHSEGPAPASAMLSGALLNIALLGIYRFLSIVDAGGYGVLGHTALLVLGVVSLLVAGLFIVRQDGAKRMLAYSSLEHMGVLAIGFGFGGPIAFAGAMYHMINHSLTKSLMFFGAGNMMRAYHTKAMSQMRRVLRYYPFSGGVWLLGAVAITGAPPFGLFLSEITILRGGIGSANPWAVWVMAVLLILIFTAFLNHFRRMIWGPEPEADAEPKLRLSFWNVLPMLLAFVPIFVLGLWWPQGLWSFFANAFRVAP